MNLCDEPLSRPLHCHFAYIVTMSHRRCFVSLFIIVLPTVCFNYSRKYRIVGLIRNTCFLLLYQLNWEDGIVKIGVKQHKTGKSRHRRFIGGVYPTIASSRTQD